MEVSIRESVLSVVLWSPLLQMAKELQKWKMVDAARAAAF
jgi:hypothetical protein